MVTAEKDAIKVEPLLAEDASPPVFALAVRIEITDGQEALQQQIRAAMGGGGGNAT